MPTSTAKKQIKKKYLDSRPHIPESIKREVRIASQHCCLVCKQNTPLEFAHIDDNRNNNIPENIALLCPNHHTMLHQGEITKKEILIYQKKRLEETKELVETKKSLDYVLGGKKIVVSSDFGQLKIKYQNMLSDFGDKLIFYQCFIYLITEFYIDSRGEDIRKIVRDLLTISIDEEKLIVDHLIRLGLVTVVGGLVVLRNRDDAKTGLSELITVHKIDPAMLVRNFIQI